MFQALRTINHFLGLVLALVILALLAVAAWVGWDTYFADRYALEQAQLQLAEREAEVEGLAHDLGLEKAKSRQLDEKLTVSQRENQQLTREIEVKDEEIAKKAEEIRRLDMAVRLLKVDHRIARIEVVSQQGSRQQRDLRTRFRFVEIDRDGRALEQPREFVIEGDVIYIDAWVIKFTDELVTLPDPVRSTSICQFRRIFGESQSPSEGFQLDPIGSRPAVYRSGGEMTEFEEKLWSRFWQYANDPAAARDAGVRAAHGEAPSIKLLTGKAYKILLRASDGLTIVTEDEPAAEVRTSAAVGAPWKPEA